MYHWNLRFIICNIILFKGIWLKNMLLMFRLIEMGFLHDLTINHSRVSYSQNSYSSVLCALVTPLNGLDWKSSPRFDYNYKCMKFYFAAPHATIEIENWEVLSTSSPPPIQSPKNEEGVVYSCMCIKCRFNFATPPPPRPNRKFRGIE